MTFRSSLRKKLVYTFLGGALVTVILLSIGIKAIMNDYFQHLADVRLQFVSDLGQQRIADGKRLAPFRNDDWGILPAEAGWDA